MKPILTFIFLAFLGNLCAQPLSATVEPADATIDQLEPADEVTVSVVVGNPGATTWPKGDIELHMRLSGRYDETAELKSIFERDIPLHQELSYNKYYTFKWNITTPDFPGKWSTQVYLTNKGKQFGEMKDIVFEIPSTKMEYKVLMTVTGDIRPAPEEPFELKYTIKNIGSYDWPEGPYVFHVYCTGAPSGASSEEKKAFDSNQKIAEFVEGLARNAYDEVKVEGMAPRTSGTYKMMAKLYHDGADFSQATGASRSFTITIPEEEPILAITRVTLEDDMIYGKPYDVTFTIRNNGTVKAEADKWEVRSLKSEPYHKGLEFVVPGEIDIEERETETLKGDDKVNVKSTIGGSSTIPEPYKMKFQIFYDNKPMGRVFDYHVSFLRK